MVRKDGCSPHRVFLVGGNGIDLISDWTCSEDDADGFGALLDRLTDRIYATYEP